MIAPWPPVAACALLNLIGDKTERTRLPTNTKTNINPQTNNNHATTTPKKAKMPGSSRTFRG
jgi:hypothetical protein